MAERAIALPMGGGASASLAGRRANLTPLPFANREQPAPQPRIALVGVGGAGVNALTRIGHSTESAVRTIALNTDMQSLTHSLADERICLGETLTQGLGTGGAPDLGERAADLSRHHIASVLRGHDLIFILAGLGGGTGSGAAPLVARIAREQGALVVGMLTMPFSFEGHRRRQTAVAALAQMAAVTDASLTIPNDRLLFVTQAGQSVQDAFIFADDAVRRAIMGIVEIVTTPGLINVDFADVRAILRDAGPSLMASGDGEGQDRAAHAVEDAMSGGWLATDIRGARRALLNITASPDVSLAEIAEVTARVADVLDPQAQSVFGAVIDPALTDTLRVTLIAAGIPQGAGG